PIIFVSGDAITIQEAETVAPEAEMVVVKQSLGRFAAAHMHPTIACELLHAGAARAVSNLSATLPPQFALPVTLEITFLVADMAEMATWIRGMERTSSRSVKVVSEDLLDLYRTFVTIVILTRSLMDR
ncbi:MAG: M55 family metallopeptidase, partial [Ktedonobacteraceae bacterium]|nr:M55 family metallopeptidase [Ktedonobacteraceae bacterium]